MLIKTKIIQCLSVTHLYSLCFQSSIESLVWLSCADSRKRTKKPCQNTIAVTSVDKASLSCTALEDTREVTLEEDHTRVEKMSLTFWDLGLLDARECTIEKLPTTLA